MEAKDLRLAAYVQSQDDWEATRRPGTPAGRMMVQMRGVFAEFERATLAECSLEWKGRRRVAVRSEGRSLRLWAAVDSNDVPPR